jgi:hypothetical protein
VAGIAYSLAWMAGPAIWLPNLEVDASGAQVLAAYGGQQAAAMTQSLLVHGVAAVALAVVVVAFGRAAGGRGADRLGRATVLAGLAAAAVSLVQFVLGQLLAGWVVPDGDAGRAGALLEAINRLDGVKMFALAAMAAAAAGLVRRAGVLPRWLGAVAGVLALALLVSGAGYLLLSNPLAQAAFVSLPLLLVWVTGTGVAVGRTGR